MSGILDNLSKPTHNKSTSSLLDASIKDSGLDPSHVILRTPQALLNSKDTGMSRYTGSPDFDHFGYSLFRDNETLYDANQSSGEWWANTLSRFGSRTGSVFIDGFRYLDGLKEMKSNLVDIEEGDRQNFTSLEEQFQQRFPLYSSPYEGTGLGAYFSKGAHGKWGQLLDQFGFSAGTILNFVATEAALAVLTEGVGAIANSIPMIANIAQKAKIANDVRRAAKIKAYKTLDNYVDVFNPATKGKFAKAVSNAALKKTSGFAPMTTKGIGQIARGIQSGNKLQVIGGSAKLTLGVWNQFNIASNEALIESAENASMYKEALINDFITYEARDPNEKELEEIDKRVEAAAGITYWGNVAVLMASNALIGGNIMSNFKGATKLAAAGSGLNRLYKTGKSGMATGKLVSSFSDLGTLRKIGVGLKNIGKATLVAPITEGMEESLQRTVGTFARTFIDNKFNEEGLTLIASIGEGFKEGFKDGFGAEGMEEFYAGFMTGAVMGSAGSIHRGAQYFDKKQRETIEGYATTINGVTSKLHDILNLNVNAQVSYAKELEDAISSGDINAFLSSRNSSLVDSVLSLVDKGSYEKWVSQLNKVKKFELDEIIDTFPMMKGSTKEEAISHINNILSKAEEIKKANDDFSMENPFEHYYLIKDKDEAEQMRLKNTSFKEAKKFIILTHSAVKDKSRRVQSMLSEINQVTEHQFYTDFLKSDGRRVRIKQLNDEIKQLDTSINNTTDSTVKNKALENKKKAEKEKAFLENYKEEASTAESNRIRLDQKNKRKELTSKIKVISDRIKVTVDLKEKKELEKEKRDLETDRLALTYELDETLATQAFINEDKNQNANQEYANRTIDAFIKYVELRKGKIISRPDAQDSIEKYLDIFTLENEVRIQQQALNFMSGNIDDFLEFILTSVTENHNNIMRGLNSRGANVAAYDKHIHTIPDLNNNIFKKFRPSKKARQGAEEKVFENSVNQRIKKLDDQAEDAFTRLNERLDKIAELQSQLEELNWIGETSDKRIKKRDTFVESDDVTTSTQRDVLEIDSTSGQDIYALGNSLINEIRILSKEISLLENLIENNKKEVSILKKEILEKDDFKTLQDLDNKLTALQKVLKTLSELFNTLMNILSAVVNLGLKNETTYEGTSDQILSNIERDLDSIESIDKNDIKKLQGPVGNFTKNANKLSEIYETLQRLRDDISEIGEKEYSALVEAILKQSIVLSNEELTTLQQELDSIIKQKEIISNKENKLRADNERFERLERREKEILKVLETQKKKKEEVKKAAARKTTNKKETKENGDKKKKQLNHIQQQLVESESDEKLGYGFAIDLLNAEGEPVRFIFVKKKLEDGTTGLYEIKEGMSFEWSEIHELILLDDISIPFSDVSFVSSITNQSEKRYGGKKPVSKKGGKSTPTKVETTTSPSNELDPHIQGNARFKRASRVNRTMSFTNKAKDFDEELSIVNAEINDLESSKEITEAEAITLKKEVRETRERYKNVINKTNETGHYVSEDEVIPLFTVFTKDNTTLYPQEDHKATKVKNSTQNGPKGVPILGLLTNDLGRVLLFDQEGNIIGSADPNSKEQKDIDGIKKHAVRIQIITHYQALETVKMGVDAGFITEEEVSSQVDEKAVKERNNVTDEVYQSKGGVISKPVRLIERSPGWIENLNSILELQQEVSEHEKQTGDPISGVEYVEEDGSAYFVTNKSNRLLMFQKRISDLSELLPNIIETLSLVISTGNNTDLGISKDVIFNFIKTVLYLPKKGNYVMQYNTKNKNITLFNKKEKREVTDKEEIVEILTELISNDHKININIDILKKEQESNDFFVLTEKDGKLEVADFEGNYIDFLKKVTGVIDIRETEKENAFFVFNTSFENKENPDNVTSSIVEAEELQQSQKEKAEKVEEELDNLVNASMPMTFSEEDGMSDMILGVNVPNEIDLSELNKRLNDTSESTEDSGSKNNTKSKKDEADDIANSEFDGLSRTKDDSTIEYTDSLEERLIDELEQLNISFKNIPQLLEKYKLLNNVIHSTAWGQWSTSVTRIFKDAKPGTILHEMWHDFSQFILTKEEKRELYKEVLNTRLDIKNDTTLSVLEKYKKIEEILAEDFVDYAKSDGKSILRGKPKRNTIFRRILKFIKSLLGKAYNKITGKELFTKKGSELLTQRLEEIYSKLLKGDLKITDYSVNNVLFTELNSSKEVTELLTTNNLLKNNPQESHQKILSHFNVKILEYIRSNIATNPSINLHSFLNDVTVQKNAFIYLKNDLLKTYNIYRDIAINNRDKLTVEDKQKLVDITSMYTKLLTPNVFRDYISEYLNSVKSFTSTKQLEEIIANELGLDENIDTIETIENEDIPTGRDVAWTKSADETQSYEVANIITRFLFKGIPQYVKNKQGKYSPNIKNGMIQIFPSETLWNIVQEETANILHYDEFIQKLIDIIDKVPEVIEILSIVPIFEQSSVDKFNQKRELLLTPAQNAKFTKVVSPVNISNNSFRNTIYGDFKRAKVSQKIGYTRIDNNGNISYVLADAPSIKIEILKDSLTAQLTNKILSKDDRLSHFYIYDEDTGYIRLDVAKLQAYISQSSSRLKKVQYSQAIRNKVLLDGFFDVFDIIGLELDRDGIKSDNDTIAEFLKTQPERIIDFLASIPEESIVPDPVYFLDQTIVTGSGKDKKTILNQSTRLKHLLNLELKFRPELSTNSVFNPKGKIQYEMSEHTFISMFLSELNNVDKYPTYQDAIKSELLTHLDISKNPDVKSSIFLNSIFDMSTGERRQINGKHVKISLNNMNGVAVSISGVFDQDSAKTTPDLSPVEKLILQEIPSLLTSGIQSNVRAADKNMEYALQFNMFFNKNIKGNYSNTDGGIVNNTAIEDFLNGRSNTVDQIFIDYLINELDNIKYFKEKGSNVKTIQQKRGDFVLFDKILPNKLKQELLIGGPSILENPAKRSEILSEIKKYILKGSAYLKKDIMNLGGNTFLDKLEIETLTNQSFENKVDVYWTLSFIHNVEQYKFIYGDIASFKDPVKRLPMYNSSGRSPLFDKYTEQLIEKDPYYKYNQRLHTKRDPEINSKIRASVVGDIGVYVDPKSIDNILKYIKDKQKEIKDAYVDDVQSDKTDAQCLCTLDFYRNVLDWMGEWSPEQEDLYKRISNKDYSHSTSEKIFFPPLKLGYTGNGELLGTANKNKSNEITKVYHKYSIVPIIPHTNKGYAMEKIEHAMYDQNLDYIVFESGSKQGTYVNNDGSLQSLYETGGVNPALKVTELPISGFKNQLKIAPEQKSENIFGTQFRKLLFVDLFEHSVPIDFKPNSKTRVAQWEKAVKNNTAENQSEIYKQLSKFNKAINQIYTEGLAKIQKEYGIYYEDGKFYIENKTALIEEIRRRDELKGIILGGKKIELRDDGSLMTILESSSDPLGIENVIFSILNKNLIRQKLNGESLVQTSSVGYETISELSNENKRYSEDLNVYDIIDGKLRKIEVMVSFNYKLYAPLLELRHSDGSKIGTIERLNEMMASDSFREKYKDGLTIVGYRIPTQGHNSMDILTIKRFLSEASTNLIVVPGQLVTKTGSDFDIDKMQLFRKKMKPNFDVQKVIKEAVSELKKDKNINNYVYSQITNKNNIVMKKTYLSSNITTENDKIKFFKNLTANYLETLFSLYFTTGFGFYNEETLTEDDKRLINKINKFIEVSDKYNSFEVDTTDASTKIIEVAEAILSNNNVIELLITPNSTSLLKQKSYLESNYSDPKETNITTDAVSPTYISEKRAANFDLKKALGIAAIANTLNSLFQLGNFTLNDTFTVDKLVFNTNNYLRHNTRNGKISMSDIKNQEGQRISEIINQFINAYVDVGTDDFGYYLNAGSNVAPVLMHMLISGTPVGDALAIIKSEYVKRFISATNNKIIDKINHALTDPKGRTSNVKKMIVETINILNTEENNTFLKNHPELKEIIEKEFKLDSLPSLTGTYESLGGKHFNGNEYSFYNAINRITSSEEFKKIAIDILQNRTSILTKEGGSLISFLQYIDLMTQSKRVREDYHFQHNNDTSSIKTFGESLTKRRIEEEIKLDNTRIVLPESIESLNKYSPIKELKIHDKVDELFEDLYPLYSSPQVIELYHKLVGETFIKDLSHFTRTFFNDISLFVIHNSDENWEKVRDLMNITKQDNIHSRLLKLKTTINSMGYEDPNLELFDHIVSFIAELYEEDSSKVKSPNLVRFRKFKQNKLSAEEIQKYKNAWTNLVNGNFSIIDRTAKEKITPTTVEHKREIQLFAKDLAQVAINYFGWNLYPGSFNNITPNQTYDNIDKIFRKALSQDSFFETNFEMFETLFKENNKKRYYKYEMVSDKKVKSFKNYNVNDGEYFSASKTETKSQTSSQRTETKQNTVPKVSSLPQGEVSEETGYVTEYVLGAETSKSSAVSKVGATEFNKLPAVSNTPTMTYAGIGSRETPTRVLFEMTEIAKYLETLGYTLNTGKTFRNKEEGADKAFSDGTSKKNLFAPEQTGQRELKIAKEIHPNWNALTAKGLGGAKLMGRNTNQIFGANLDTPVDFVLFYAEETSDPLRPKGGTGQAVEMARRKGIPTINIVDKNWKEQLNKILNKPGKQPTVSKVVTSEFKSEGFEGIRKINDSKVYTLDNNTHIYSINGNKVTGDGGSHMSVSNYLGNNIERENNLTKVSTTAGSIVDDIFKDYFNGNLNDQDYIAHFKNQKDLEKLKEQFKRLRATLNKRGFTDVISGAIVEGQLLNSLENKNQDLIGEIDLLAYNPSTKEYMIVDLKTHKGGTSMGVNSLGQQSYRDPKLTKYTRQQSLYKQLVSTYNIPLNKISTFLFNIEIEYDGNYKLSGTKNINIIEGVHVPGVIENATTRRIIKNGIFVELSNIPDVFDKEIGELKIEKGKRLFYSDKDYNITLFDNTKESELSPVGSDEFNKCN